MLKIIKDWILRQDFVILYMNEIWGERVEDVTRTAFCNARKDLEETNAYDVDTKATELSNKKLNDLLSVVDNDKIVSFDKKTGVIYIGGVRVDEGRLHNLKAEAEFFLESDLWHLIHETPKELAQRSMFVAGETLADMAKGKSMLYTLSTQKNIIDIFKKYAPKPPTPTKPSP